MKNKYIAATALALIAASQHCNAQQVGNTPKLVVNITIDQLRTDYLESFNHLYGDNGFKRLITDGLMYTSVQYPYSPIDRASAIATLNTGSTPNYNGIVAEQWFDRTSLRPVSCVEDNNYDGLLTNERVSAHNVLTTTISDELKIATKGKGIIYSIAERKETAVIPAGHNGDGAFWVNGQNNCWCTSTYYNKKAPKWLETYNLYNSPYQKNSCINEQITDLAIKCISLNSLGKDNVTDMLFVTYNAAPAIDKNGIENCQDVYLQIDRDLGRLMTNLQATVGLDNVLFVVNGTGYYNQLKNDDKKFRIPGGTLYINRTANLLNMYLGAIYGSDKYVEGFHDNQIYLNTKLLDKKRLNYNKITELAKSFLRQSQGVANAFSGDNVMSNYSPELDKIRHGFNISKCGDLLIETSPGWDIYNEETHKQSSSSTAYIQSPVLFYGFNVKKGKETSPISIEKVSPTIAKSIHIRAPNACKEAPLF